MDIDVELEVVVVFSKVGLVFGEAKVEGPVVCSGAANVELVVDPKVVLVVDEANVERFELLTGPPLAKVSLKP